MNVGTDKNFIKSRKLLIMVKNVGNKIKCRRLMKNIKSPNSGLILVATYKYKQTMYPCIY